MLPKTSIVQLILAFAWLALAQAHAPACLDEQGDPVDWYIAYKFPQLSNDVEPFKSGYAYGYITSDMVTQRDPTAWSALRDVDLDSIVFLNQFRRLLVKYLGYPMPVRKPTVDLSGMRTISRGKDRNNLKSAPVEVPAEVKDDLSWTISENLITDPKSIVMRTLSPAYVLKKGEALHDLNSIYYNDGPPEKVDKEGNALPSLSNGARAHAKGVLLIDEKSQNGVWLTHSTPQFPPPRNMTLKFGPNSRRYGQTFMCISFDVNRSGKQIVHHLANMNPLVYESYISKRLYELIPELDHLKLENDGAKRRKKYEDPRVAQVITTREGQDLYVYSKSSDYNDDLYSGWIDHELKTTLYVETWRNGAGVVLNSSCPQTDYKVNNIVDLKVEEGDTKITWSYSQDHSKWAISQDKDPGVVCISDINRMQSQFKRGGGAVCIKCPSCWSVFSNTILDLEPCAVNKNVNKSKTEHSNRWDFDDDLFDKFKRFLHIS